MRFGQTLKESIYPPWKDHYLDYSTLKKQIESPEKEWNEESQSRFYEELLNTQLNRVADFQALTFKELEQRTAKVGEKLKDLAPDDNTKKGDITIGRFKELENELDSITNEINELKKFSSVNYTGFFKICKKHDRFVIWVNCQYL